MSYDAAEASAEQIEQWVLRAREGDRDAFAQLYRATRGPIFGLCLKLTLSRASADELLQDAYSRAIESLDELKEPRKFRSWLATIARNQFLAWARSPRAKEMPTDPFDSPEQASDDPEVHQVIAVRAALAALKPEDRVALCLVDMEGHSYAEAAEVLGVSVASLTSRIVRARARFLEKFNAG